MAGFLKCFRPELHSDKSKTSISFPAFLDEVNHFININEILYAIMCLQTGHEIIEIRMYKHQTAIHHAGRRVFHTAFPYEKLCHHQNLADNGRVSIVVSNTGDIMFYKSLFNKYATLNFMVTVVTHDI